jgi:molecular chaperone HscB
MTSCCPFCKKPTGAEFLARHVCASCGKPQPLTSFGASEDAVKDRDTYFSALGTTEKFRQDGAELQKRFYEVSRALHPDRFTTADSETKRISLDRMSFLNEAYRTLKTPAALRDYILQLHGLKAEAGARGQVPMALAEGWFDLQDSLTEDPDQAAGKLLGFERELKDFRESTEKAIREGEDRYDQVVMNPGTAEEERAKILKSIAQHVQELSYLNSLDRDVERIKARLGSGF